VPKCPSKQDNFIHNSTDHQSGGRLGGGEETLGHISEHRFRFLACSGALRLLQGSSSAVDG